MPAADITTTCPDASLPSNCVGGTTLHTQQPILMRHSTGCIHVSTDVGLIAPSSVVARLDGEMLPAEGLHHVTSVHPDSGTGVNIISAL